jgi:hypothetical protein
VTGAIQTCPNTSRAVLFPTRAEILFALLYGMLTMKTPMQAAHGNHAFSHLAQKAGAAYVPFTTHRHDRSTS